MYSVLANSMVPTFQLVIATLLFFFFQSLIHTMALSERQPDFARISDIINDLSVEIRYCDNIPAINQGNELLHALEELTRTVNTRFDRIETRLDLLEQRSRAANQNQLARLANSTITRPDSRLRPLVGASDNSAIPEFPSTPSQLMTLSSVALTECLRRLESDTTGTANEKKKRLRFEVGLVVDTT